MASVSSSSLIKQMSSELFCLPPLILPPSTSAMVDPFVPPPAPPSLPNVPFSGGALELMAVPKKKSPDRGIQNGLKALKHVPVIVGCRIRASFNTLTSKVPTLLLESRDISLYRISSQDRCCECSRSNYAEFGTTKVIVFVFGPRESKKAMMYSEVGRLNCNVSFTTFSTPIRGQGSDNMEYSSMLHKALEGVIMVETFPKTTVDIFALVLESGGSDLPVIISCASLALADAGIMMYDLVSSVSVSCLGRNLIIDPTADEEAFQDGSFMVTYMPSCKEVTQLTLTGEWSTAKINEAMELCTDACLKLADIMRSCLREAVAGSS